MNGKTYVLELNRLKLACKKFVSMCIPYEAAIFDYTWNSYWKALPDEFKDQPECFIISSSEAFSITAPGASGHETIDSFFPLHILSSVYFKLLRSEEIEIPTLEILKRNIESACTNNHINQRIKNILLQHGSIILHELLYKNDDDKSKGKDKQRCYDRIFRTNH